MHNNNNSNVKLSRMAAAQILRRPHQKIKNNQQETFNPPRQQTQINKKQIIRFPKRPQNKITLTTLLTNLTLKSAGSPQPQTNPPAALQNLTNPQSPKFPPLPLTPNLRLIVQSNKINPQL